MMPFDFEDIKYGNMCKKWPILLNEIKYLRIFLIVIFLLNEQMIANMMLFVFEDQRCGYKNGQLIMKNIKNNEGLRKFYKFNI